MAHELVLFFLGLETGNVLVETGQLKQLLDRMGRVLADDNRLAYDLGDVVFVEASRACETRSLVLADGRPEVNLQSRKR